MPTRWSERLRNRPAATAAFLFLAVAVTYAEALRGVFVHDDNPQIVANPFIQNPRLWMQIFTGSVWSFNGAATHDNFYRPLQFFFYWLVYRAAGPNAVVFHLLQLFFYAATAWLVYRIGCELLRDESAAFLGAVLWILHPLHVEAVAWISALSEVGFAFFYLSAFLLFLRAAKTEGGGIRPYLLGALIYLPALFFKEMAASLPLLLVAYWLFLAPRGTVTRATVWADRAVCLAPYLAAVALYLMARIKVLGAVARTPWHVSRVEIEAAAALLGQHARLFFFPVGLGPYRTFALRSALFSPWPWLALAALLGTLWLRPREPRLSFLVAWWGITLLPCLAIRQLSTPLVADRFSYLPSVGLCLALSGAVVRLARPAPVRREIRAWRAVAASLALLAVFWTARTILAIPKWHDDERLLQNGLKQSPDAAGPHFVRGDELRYRHDDLDGAEREYRLALALNQKALVPSSGLAYQCYVSLGQVAQRRGLIEEALGYYHQAAEMKPGSALAYDALGAFYLPRGDYAEAARYYTKAVQANPQDVGAHFALGTCWMKLGDYRQAAGEFRAARTVDPTAQIAYASEARALEAAGEPQEASRVRALGKN